MGIVEDNAACIVPAIKQGQNFLTNHFIIITEYSVTMTSICQSLCTENTIAVRGQLYETNKTAP